METTHLEIWLFREFLDLECFSAMCAWMGGSFNVICPQCELLCVSHYLFSHYTFDIPTINFLHLNYLHWGPPFFWVPVCVLICCFRLPDCAKLLLHWWQAWGFSPLCVRMCIFSSLGQLQLMPHCWQAQGFSPLCVPMCFFRSPECVKLLLYLKLWQT